MVQESEVAGLLLDLAFVGDRWDQLAESCVPGTARPWRQPLLDAERRAELAARDREERSVRDPDAPGFTSAPMYLDALDVMVEVWLIVHELVQRIELVVERFVPGKDRHPSVLGLPAYRLRRLDEMDSMLPFVSTWLQFALDLDDDGTVGAAVGRLERRLSRLTREVQRLLSLLRGGQLLAAAVCPWCRGVTPKHPAGGATTLRVEEIERAKPANEHRPAVDALYAVVCWNTSCEPSDADCGTRWHGHPAWPAHEWDWLAARLLTAEPAVASQAAPAVPADFTIIPIEHSGRTGRATEGAPA